MTDSSVCVVIPTYNHAHYLPEAIESALAQLTLPSEIVVVDDGSIDDPCTVAQNYPGIRFIRQKNQGLAAARNTGWRTATSRYLVFLDADDVLLPDAIATNLNLFAQHPDCAFVYGGFRRMTENRIFGYSFCSVGDDPYAALLSKNCIGMHATVMYRRDRIADVGGFNRHLPACEDYDLYLRLARRFPVACAPDLIADYRIHSSQMSGDPAFMLRNALRVLSHQKRHAQSRPEWAAAYQSGIANWKSYYAGVHIQKLKKGLRTGANTPRLLREFIGVARQAPGTVTGQAARHLGGAVRGRLMKAATAKGVVRWGDLRRTKPISTRFGFDRGTPIDRRYIEAFLSRHADDIRGQVLEIGDDSYTIRFGNDRVTKCDVLNRFPGHPKTTFTGDLAEGAGLPPDTFDCVVLTQTLHLIYDMRAAVRSLARILKPGGILLITVPGITPIDREEWRESWYWSLTALALRQLLEEQFVPHDIETTSYGNVLAATAFLYGLAEHELTPRELDEEDPCYPVLVAARVQKRAVP